MFITFEGIEGSGKTTQVELLYNYLTEKGMDVVKTREPGGTIFGEALRKVFLQPDIHVYPLSELLVFMAMRAQHVEEVILPALKEGKIVISDRFSDASYAYQGYGRGIALGIITTLNRLVTKGVTPNLTVLLNCTVDEGFKRKMVNGIALDRFEKEAIAFHKRIRQGYRNISKEEPNRFLVINGNKGIEETHRIIKNRVERLLKDHGV
jgi:dTMP kinase